MMMFWDLNHSSNQSFFADNNWDNKSWYRFQFEVLGRRLVEGHSFEEMRADLHGDGGQLALDGLGGGLHPASLLGLRLAAAALQAHTHTHVDINTTVHKENIDTCCRHKTLKELLAFPTTSFKEK